MVPNKTLTLILVNALIFSAGCAGSRLKNLVSRSDYSELDDQEFADSSDSDLYDEGTDSADRLVSQSRDVEESPSEEAPSRFSLSRLFGRDKVDSDLYEDPFVESLVDEEAAENLSRKLEGAIRPLRNDAKAELDAPSKNVRRLSASIDEVERQAEDLFSELQQASDRSQQNPFAQVSDSQDSLPGQTRSFEDYLEKQAKSVAEPFIEETSFYEESLAERRQAEESVPAPDFSDAFDFSPAGNARDSADGFDALMSEVDPPQNSPSTNPFADDSSFSDQFSAGSRPAEEFQTVDIFAQTDDVFADALGLTPELPDDPQLTESVFESQVPEITPAPKADDAIRKQDRFTAASEKHGFGALSDQGAWADFENAGSSAQPDPLEPPEPVEPEFSWDGTASSLFSQQDESESDVVQLASAAVDENPFLPVADSSDEPLLIPGPVEDTASVEQPAESENSEESFFGTPEDSSLLEVPFDGFDVEEPTGATVGGPATIMGVPNRLWFFVLGCIALAALIFMPSRKNQTN